MMEDIYLFGFWCAFLIGLVKIFFTVTNYLSLRAQNLKKVGLYYTPFQGAFNATSPARAGTFIFYVVYMLILAPLFSWGSVLSAAWGFGSWLSNRTAVPEKLKEVYYKMANLELSKDQLIALQEEIARTLNVPLTIHKGNAEEGSVDPYTLVTDAGDYYQEFNVHPTTRTLYILGHTKDGEWVNRSTISYRFDGLILETKLIESSKAHYGKKEWDVRDNVILESEIRSRNEALRFKIGSVEETLKKYREQIEWHPLNRYDVRFFVMGKHPEIFSNADLKTVIRSELEKFRVAKIKVLEKCKTMAIDIVETDAGFGFRYPENATETQKKEVDKLFSEESMRSFGTSNDLLHISKKYEDDLLRLLGDKKAA